MRVLISAIPKFTADSYIYLLESLGLGVIALELEFIARALNGNRTKRIHGPSTRASRYRFNRSNLIVYDDNAIQFTTSLPYSGELLTTALSQKLHATREETNALKKNMGLPTKTKMRGPSLLEKQKNLRKI